MLHQIYSNFGYLTHYKTDIRYYDINISLQRIIEFARHCGYVFQEFGDGDKPDFASHGYKQGIVWVYDPTDPNGSFGDVPYTRKWRYLHELAHALTYQDMLEYYNIKRIYRGHGPLSYPHASIALDWEVQTLYVQYNLMEYLQGYKPDEYSMNHELNTLSADLIERCWTGEFTNPHEDGFVPFNHFGESLVEHVLRKLYKM